MYGYSEMTFLVYHDREVNEQSTVMGRNLVANTSSNKTFVVVKKCYLHTYVLSNFQQGEECMTELLYCKKGPRHD